MATRMTRRFSDVCTAIASSRHSLNDDPADLMDELVYDIVTPPASRALDTLAGWIFNTLAEHPMSAPILVRYIRMQRPRILPEAIEQVIQQLMNRRMIEADARHRLRIKGFLPIGFSISRTGL